MLTATAIEGLKPRRERYEVSEPGGLRVRVYPSGRKTFIWRYRNPAGKQSVIALGCVRPRGGRRGLSLKEAKRKLALMQADRDRGVDPAEQRAAQRQEHVERFKERAGAPTVGDVLDEYLDQHVHRRGSAATRSEFGRLVETNIRPACGKLKAADLTRSRLVAALDRIAKEATPSVADHAAVVLRGAFNFAVRRGRIDSTPAQSLPRYVLQAPRDRVLKDAEIKALWKALDAGKGISEPVRLAVRLLLLTAQRRSSLALARWDEFGADAWEIPAEHSKTGSALVVPLSPAAKAVVARLRALTGKTEWVLPNPKLSGPIRPKALTRAVSRLRGSGTFTLHDLRRTAATLMARAGVQRFVIGRVLGHADPSVTGIYDRYEYQAEKRRALEALGRSVAQIATGTKRRAKVVRMR